MILFTIVALFLFTTVEVHTAEPKCPGNDGGKTVYFSADVCAQFWMCAEGIPYLFTCPDGLDFNIELEICDWPRRAACKNVIVENPDEQFGKPVDDSNPDLIENPDEHFGMPVEDSDKEYQLPDIIDNFDEGFGVHDFDTIIVQNPDEKFGKPVENADQDAIDHLDEGFGVPGSDTIFVPNPDEQFGVDAINQ